MKKILNNPSDYVDEMLAGLIAAHPGYYALQGETGRVVTRANPGRAGKVGIVTGGGSGHLPVFTGYVGTGLLDACAIGDVFASPSAEQMAEAIRAAHQGAGVLRLYGNYGGDIMNFDMAGDLVEFDDITCTSVVLADDIASAPLAEREKRRGVGGGRRRCLLRVGTCGGGCGGSAGQNGEPRRGCIGGGGGRRGFGGGGEARTGAGCRRVLLFWRVR
jgi:dihydroxyacetone kinase-like protein